MDDGINIKTRDDIFTLANSIVSTSSIIMWQWDIWMLAFREEQGRC